MEEVRGFLDGKRNIHFLGIGGVGISAVAKLLKDLGHRVSGSDTGTYPPTTGYLERMGIPFVNSFSAKNIPSDTDLVVMGMSNKLRKEHNEEIEEVYKRQLPVTHFPHILSILTEKTNNLVCVGSYGKSTCAALAAFALSFTGKDPSFFIGAIPYDLEVSSRVGSGRVFILEGDEYPTSLNDPSPKFLHYNAQTVLVTSMSHDHFDVYPTQESFSESFIELAQQIPPDGLAIVNTDKKETKSFRDALSCQFVGYGLSHDATWHAEDIVHGDQTTFRLMRNGKEIGKGSTPLLGTHNIENVVGVGALLIEKGLLSTEEYLVAVREFHGLRRRLDKLTSGSRVPLYEGFGSSYEKVRSVISAIRAHHNGRLLVLFEPYAMSWKHELYREKYATLFEGADHVFFYAATFTSTTNNGLTLAEITQLVKEPIEVLNNMEDIEKVKRYVREGDCILALSSGNFDGMLGQLTAWLDARYPTV